MLELRASRENFRTSPVLRASRSPAANSSYLKTYRVQGIPLGFDQIAVKKYLLHGLSLSNLTIHSLASDPRNQVLQVATVSFYQTPPSTNIHSWYKPPVPEPPRRPCLDDHEYTILPTSVSIDCDFYGFTPLNSFNDERDHRVDCIAISGLGGHALGSFKERKGNHLWLRDSLINDLGCARVLLYGYDAHLPNSNSFQDIEAIASSFRTALRAVRRQIGDALPKPIIFIGHSLGGLIIKEALIQMKQGNDIDRSNFASTLGILFFGVPNQGMDINSLIPMTESQPNLPLLMTLRRGSGELRRLSREFNKEFDSRDSIIISYYETEQSPSAHHFNGIWNMTGPPVILVDRVSATHGRAWEVGSYYTQAIRKTHSDLVKFAKFEETYYSVLDQLRDLTHHAESVVQRRWKASKDTVHSHELSPLEQDCLRTLYRCDYNSQKNRNPTPTPGTCTWVLSHQNFQQWQQDENSNLLWFSADPGCGKSVLASFLVDEMKAAQTTHRPRKVCYFFFKDNDEQNSATLALCSLLHQLFTLDITLLKHVMGEYQMKGQKITTEFSSLWNILLAVASDSRSHDLTIVIDGLDECKEDDRLELIKALVLLFSTPESSRSYHLKILITSRPYLSIETEFEELGLGIIRLQAENETAHLQHDVDVFIRDKVKRIGRSKRLPRERQLSLARSLYVASDGSFLWVHLVLGLIEESGRANEKTLNNLITTVPSTLAEVYDKILSQSKDIKNARRILNIVIAATRPLTVEELNIAFSIQPENLSSEDLDLEPDMDSTLKALCNLFVRVIHSKVYLIHQTAKEFLVTQSPIMIAHPSPNPTSWCKSISLAKAHFTLGMACVSYLLFSDFQTGPFKTHQFKYGEMNLRLIKECKLKHAFLDYAAMNVATHYQMTGSEYKATLLDPVRRICKAQSGEFNRLCLLVSPKETIRQRLRDGFTAAAFLGLDGLVTLYLEQFQQDAIIGKLDEGGANALHRASEHGNEETVKILINSGAPLESRTHGHRETALHLAAAHGQSTVVLLLLLHGADIEARDCIESTPLLTAVSSDALDAERTVQGLLDYGADINATDKHGNTALHRAASKGWSYWILKLLLERGANPNAKNRRQQTALHCSIGKYRKEDVKRIIRLLLKKGTSITSDLNGYTPLHLTTLRRAVDELAVLLELGIKDSGDSSGQTALDIARKQMVRTDKEITFSSSSKWDTASGRAATAKEYGDAYREDNKVMFDLLLKYQ
ncbi:MAG: hypothetical protein M1834_003079 [Cirrosporium novae-zelandiae]|nr:MAG: hypothetical protein M1834_003079 [Cirrosporium novae-zelandiae]